MDPDAVIVTETVLAGTQHGDLSLWTLILRADIVVQAVMLGLVFASIWTWAVVYEKMRLIRRLHRQAVDFEKIFWGGRSLDKLMKQIDASHAHPMAAVFASAMTEWNHLKKVVSDRPSSGSVSDGLGGNVEPIAHVGKVMELVIERELERLEQRLLGLATVGSVAPFVGLFGTVWGIMNSFQSIALNQDTSLAVVAPGIAEALLATALGLLAAIPAVIFYNRLNNEIASYRQRLENFSDDVAIILSRSRVGVS
ncbi:MAG: protein TolQ [Parvularculales bacterium]